MVTPSDVVRIPDVDYWRINKVKNSTYSIEWTSKLGGWCRAKLDSMDVWHFARCENVRFAIDFGYRLIERQKKAREYGDYDPNYQGA